MPQLSLIPQDASLAGTERIVFTNGTYATVDQVRELSRVYPEVVAPATPATGQVVVYAKADGRMYLKDDLGVEAALGTVTLAGYIEGLTMQWVSATAITVTSGEAYIEGLASVVAVPTAIAKVGITLVAATWYHAYLFLNAGVPDIEFVTTAPVAYRGSAMRKTGDTSRRYIGSVRTNASAQIFAFQQAGSVIRYLTDSTVAPFRFLSAGAATVLTNASAAAVVPVTSRLAKIYVNNIDATFGMEIGQTTATRITAINAKGAVTFESFALTSTQSMTYLMSGAAASAFIDVLGYTYER